MPSDICRDNLQWLAETNPNLLSLAGKDFDSGAVVVTPSRRGAPSLRVGDLQLHSAYDPIAEADRLAERSLADVTQGACIVMLGLGLGYFAQAVRRRWDGLLAVIEGDPDVFSAAALWGSLSGLGETKLIISEDAEQAALLLKPLAAVAGGWAKLTFIRHPASVKRFPHFYDEVEALAKARGSQSADPLGVLVVTPLYGGSLPIARYCANAFRRLGHRVETLDNEIYDPGRRQIETASRDRRHCRQLLNLLTTLMAETITARALDRAVDLVWLVAQSPMTPAVAAELRKHGIPTAFWFVEEWQLLTYWRESAPIYDYFFTIQREPFLRDLRDRGVKRARYLPLAADPYIHRPLELTPAEIAEYGSEISHVGAGYRNRRQVFSGLAGFDFKLWGNDWAMPGVLSKVLQRDGARISTAESVKVFNAATINLNLHSSEFHDGVNPDGDYLNPRTFEIAACGGFQLVDRRRDLDEYFRPGEDIVAFDDARELPLLIRYYLDHPDERRAIAAAGRQRVCAGHTYDLRMADALDYIFSRENRVRASSRHPNHIENLIKGADGDPDLLALLEELRGAGVVTLDDIIERIRLRDGQLTTPETIFLLLFEFRRWAAEKDLV